MKSTSVSREKHKKYIKALSLVKRIRYEIRSTWYVRIPFTWKYGLRYLYDQKFRKRMSYHRWKKHRTKSVNNAAHQRRRVAKRDGFRCNHCYIKKNLTLDHVIKIADGGADELHNWQLLCVKCHEGKDNTKSRK